ncbi:MAG: hypothetical protein M3O28_03630 [Actinomycetota bacterium]|nr:hypothetical protein [Actinomycetota bacterium]
MPIRSATRPRQARGHAADAIAVSLAAAVVIAGCSSATKTAPVAGTSSSSSASPAAALEAVTTLKMTGGHLTDGAGRTLYLWTADSAARSTCAGGCAQVWPPVSPHGTPAAGAGVTGADISTLTRSDGAVQLAYAGHPLYYFASDTAPGDTKGQGSDSFGAKWWELDAGGHELTSSSGPPSTSPSGPPSSSSPAGYHY